MCRCRTSCVSAATAVRGEAPKLRHWVKEVKAAMQDLDIDPSFCERSVNEGFSGGEKKRHEILQLGLLKPKIAILDETDSGLDVDALRVVSEGVNRYAEAEHGGVLLITHYTRILRYIQPQFVHVFVGGRIVESGGPELADELEEHGYVRFTQTKAATRCARLRRACDRRRRPPRGPDMTVSVTRPAALDLAAIRADFPILSRGHAGRKSAGLPGFRCDVAAAGAGARRRAGIPHHLQRRGAPRCASADGGGHRRLRAGPRRHRRRSSAPTRTSWCSPRTPPNRSTWCRMCWGTTGSNVPSAPATSSSPPSSSTTPTWSRGRSWPDAPAPRCAGTA